MWPAGPWIEATWWVCLLFGLLFMAVMITGCFLLARLVMRGGMCGHGSSVARDTEGPRRPG